MVWTAAHLIHPTGSRLLMQGAGRRRIVAELAISEREAGKLAEARPTGPRDEHVCRRATTHASFICSTVALMSAVMPRQC